MFNENCNKCNFEGQPPSSNISDCIGLNELHVNEYDGKLF